MNKAVDELNALEMQINELDKTPLFMRINLMMPILKQLLVVLRALVISK